MVVVVKAVVGEVLGVVVVVVVVVVVGAAVTTPNSHSSGGRVRGWVRVSPIRMHEVRSGDVASSLAAWGLAIVASILPPAAHRQPGQQEARDGDEQSSSSSSSSGSSSGSSIRISIRIRIRIRSCCSNISPPPHSGISATGVGGPGGPVT